MEINYIEKLMKVNFFFLGFGPLKSSDFHIQLLAFVWTTYSVYIIII